jgi:hypothetical protein
VRRLYTRYSMAAAVGTLAPIALGAVSSTYQPPASAQPVGSHQSVGTQFTSYDIYLTPHPDDEAGSQAIWANNSENNRFPVFVYMTNGENTQYCTTVGPQNTAWTSPPLGNSGLVAEGNDPQTYPTDPSMSASTGWTPLMNLPGRAGPCRAERLDSTVNFWNRAFHLTSSSPTPDPSLNQPPTGQACFSADPVSYESMPGSIPAFGISVTQGQLSSKDNCAYYWDTPTGDIVVFNLGDMNSMWFSCPGVRPAGSNFSGSSTCDSNGANISYNSGAEGYSLSPADVTWAVEQLIRSGPSQGIIPNLQLGNIYSDAFVNTNFEPDTWNGEGSGFGAANASYGSASCDFYGHPNHRAISVASFDSTFAPNVRNNGLTCGGDVDASIQAVGVPGIQSQLFYGGESSIFWQSYGWDINCTGNFSTQERANSCSPSTAPELGGVFDWDAIGGPEESGSFNSANAGTCSPGGAEQEEFSCVESYWVRGGSSIVTAPSSTETGM